jgi:hypothetical protein
MFRWNLLCFEACELYLTTHCQAADSSVKSTLA